MHYFSIDLMIKVLLALLWILQAPYFNEHANEQEKGLKTVLLVAIVAFAFISILIGGYPC